MMRTRNGTRSNSYERKAVLYRHRAKELAAIADDGNHPETHDQLHQLSDDYHKLAHQMDELCDFEKLLRRR